MSRGVAGELTAIEGMTGRPGLVWTRAPGALAQVGASGFAPRQTFRGYGANTQGVPLSFVIRMRTGLKACSWARLLTSGLPGMNRRHVWSEAKV